jgi:hypothetical protein
MPANSTGYHIAGSTGIEMPVMGSQEQEILDCLYQGLKNSKRLYAASAIS